VASDRRACGLLFRSQGLLTYHEIRLSRRLVRGTEGWGRGRDGQEGRDLAGEASCVLLSWKLQGGDGGQEERKGDAPDWRIGPSKTRVATLGSQ